MKPKIFEPRIVLKRRETATVKRRSNLTPAKNLLGAPASRRLVGSQKPKFAGETPALPGTAQRVCIGEFLLVSTSIRVHPCLKLFLRFS
jgi:hypothetical protein